MANRSSKTQIGIIMGSQSDWPTMKAAADMLDALRVRYETRIVSAHRTPDRMAAYAKGAEIRGLQVIIAGAGGAAHLPGMVASGPSARLTRHPRWQGSRLQEPRRPRRPGAGASLRAALPARRRRAPARWRRAAPR